MSCSECVDVLPSSVLLRTQTLTRNIRHHLWMWLNLPRLRILMEPTAVKRKQMQTTISISLDELHIWATAHSRCAAFSILQCKHVTVAVWHTRWCPVVDYEGAPIKCVCVFVHAGEQRRFHQSSLNWLNPCPAWAAKASNTPAVSISCSSQEPALLYWPFQVPYYPCFQMLLPCTVNHPGYFSLYLSIYIPIFLLI